MLFVALFFAGIASAETFVEGFAMPAGIVVDASGNVYVHSDFPPSTTRVSKFAAGGALLLQSAGLGGINPFEFVGSRLERNPLTGGLILLSPRGVLLVVDTTTLTFAVGLDLGPILANTLANNVFDVATQITRTVVLGTPSYGDVAVRQRPDGSLEIFATALTTGAGDFPIIVRMRTDTAGTVNDVRVVVTSTSNVSGLQVNTPQGIAVAPDGTVLTSIAVPEGATNIKGLAAFDADFPETGVGTPVVLVDANTQILDASTAGMTTDSNGNFYVVTDAVGARLCGVGASGSLLMLNSALTAIACIPSSAILSRTGDLALSPDDSTLYITTGNRVERLFVSPPTTMPPNDNCGDPSEDGAITASDALEILNAGVGLVVCALCVCDVNANGTITASDALQVLRAAVGLSVSLECALC